MKAPYNLLTDQQLIGIVKSHEAFVRVMHDAGRELVSMAMELLEMRMSYGSLLEEGVTALDAESECFTKMKDPTK